MDAGGREEHFSRFHTQIINESFHESIERYLFKGVTVSCESICVVFSVFRNFSRKKTRILLDMTTYVFDRNSREQPQIFVSFPN